MSKISVKYNGELRVNMTHTDSKVSIHTDAPLDNNGLGMSFSPTDLTASSLAACMITILGIHDSKKNWGIESMEAEVEKIMTSNPRKIQQINIELSIKTKEINEDLKSQIKEVALNCPVAHSLHSDLNQSVTFKFT